MSNQTDQKIDAKTDCECAAKDGYVTQAYEYYYQYRQVRGLGQLAQNPWQLTMVLFGMAIAAVVIPQVFGGGE